MSSPLCFNRSSRIERQAYKWVMKMFDDPGHHAPALARWLDKDPEHRVVYKRVAIEVGYASDAAAQLPSLRADARMAGTHASAKPPGRRLLTAGVVAAAMLMLLLLGWQASRSAIFQPASDMPMIQTAGISGGTKSLTLTDGSQIVLLGATSLRVRYGPAERAIDLQNGRARFTVAHDVARPFVVHVRGGTVTAVGTIFEVDADRDVSVRLLSGRVKVALPERVVGRRDRNVVLTSGQQVAFDSSGQIVASSARGGDTAQAGAGIESFDDVPAAEIIAQVNWSSPVKIILADNDARKKRIFADLDVSDADGVARKLASVLGLTVDRSTPNEIRLKKIH